MSEFTKGPWFVTEDGYILQSEGQRRLYIASAVDIPSKDGGDKATKANLNLMAASPELLEGCKDALRVLEAMGHRDTVCAIDLRTLISKAEGK